MSDEQATMDRVLTSSPGGTIKAKYVVGQQIGQPGQFGTAHVVQEKSTGNKFAAKRIGKSKFSHKDRQFHFEQLRNEIQIMLSLDHDNIIKIYETFEDARDIWIVMELCKGGELFDRIKNQPTGNYTEKDAAAVLAQMATGIKYLHDNSIAHCDLKPDNFLFQTKSKESPLKIIDFGMSKMVSTNKVKYLTSFRGTPYYVAPEVLQGKYLMQCDMWSFGVVMFVMLFGYPPFHDENDDRLFRKIKAGFSPVVKKGFGAWFPQSIPVSDDARDLIERCLVMDTGKRLTAGEALEHKWFHGGAPDLPLQGVLKSLMEFTGKGALRNHVLQQMADVMTSADLRELRESFKNMDKDGNGRLSVDELKVAGLGENVEQLIRLADVDGDGEISWEELLMTAVNRKLRATEERLYLAFSRFDINGDGTISQSELAQVLGVDEKTSSELLAEMDSDEDGTISYEEFYKVMMHKEEEDLGIE